MTDIVTWTMTDIQVSS